MIHRLFLGITFFLAKPNNKLPAKTKEEPNKHLINDFFFFHFLQLQDVDLTTFLGLACLVAGPTTRAEKLPEGLEEQVESTIIDPIARLRKSNTSNTSNLKK